MANLLSDRLLGVIDDIAFYLCNALGVQVPTGPERPEFTLEGVVYLVDSRRTLMVVGLAYQVAQ